MREEKSSRAADIPGRQELYAFYRRHLEETVLPFWLENSIDEEYGGFYTCFDNTTGRLIGTDKYIWSQGRMAWVMSKLSSMDIFPDVQRARFLALAKKTADFLMAHARDESGACVFLTSRSGAPKPAYPGGGLCPSIYADCFVVLGLSRFAAVSGSAEALRFAEELYQSVRSRLASGQYETLPYPRIEGYRVHGISMIMNDTSRELSAAMAACGHAGADGVFANAVGYAQTSLDCFAGENGLLREMVRESCETDDRFLHGRFINPGHSLENMWFIVHTGLRAGNIQLAQRAVAVAQKTFDAGWDGEYGGILTFCDMDGGPPKGETAGYEDQPMVKKVQGDWTNKLWWPHSEGLYMLLLAYSQTEDSSFMERYHRLHDYVFSTFPNPAGPGMEWIQIRDRQGNPENKVVALPVKDPYHIIRNLALIIDLLSEQPHTVT